MNSEIVDAVTEWSTSQFSGGYEGLHALADRGFSGAITEGTVWAFMLNGRLLGIDEGTVTAFAEADGTAYESPDSALPLLYAMQSRGEKQAEYYTNEKPISEADDTLSSGSFTGYIELSENVLSGDYYIVYYGGKSMSVAFVGNSRKLLTDEKAFSRADNEVGIYTVYAADLDVIEIPEPVHASEPEAEPETDADPSPTESTDDHEESTDDRTESSDSQTADTTSSTSVDTESGETVTEDTADESDTTSPTPETGEPASERSTSETDSVGGTEPDSAVDRAESTTGRTERQPSPAPSAERSEPTQTSSSTTAAADSSVDSESDKSVFSDEAEWRDAKTIPSLDPSSDPDRTQETQSTTQRSVSKTTQRNARSGAQSSEQSKPLSRKQLRQRLKRAEQIMQKAEEQHERLINERDSAQPERDEARKELQEVRTQLSAAEAEIETLEGKLESQPEDNTSQLPTPSHTMSPAEALEGTNLLVRYDSKGEATLADAKAGNATQSDVRANLMIEPHTTFESKTLIVDDEEFETFLEDRIELAFVRWLVTEFLFDIQQTGNQNDLPAIYEAIPEVNRIELRGNVDLGTDSEGDTVHAQFDVVVRNKRGQPLFVADFNESKQPVGSGMIDSLVRDGSEIVTLTDSFAAAFAVTTSYYKADALDAAADATGGGLLNPSRGKSFVYVSRKQGFHLCLVEMLGDSFDLHVPEL
jgi:hypothetical protein